MLVSFLSSQFAFGQKMKNYEGVVNACLKAVKAFTDNGSRSELEAASRELKTYTWSELILLDNDVHDAISLDGRMIFSTEYFDDVINKAAVYKTASEYLSGLRGASGGSTSLTTKGVRALGKVAYEYPLRGKCQVNVAIVAEATRNLNLKVTVINPQGQELDLRDNYKETQGLPFRKIENIQCSEIGNFSLIITVENKSDKPTSFACIVDVKKIL